MSKHKLSEMQEAERPEKKMLTEHEQALKELGDVQTALGEVDRRCAKEQIAVQKKFDEEKKPHLEARQKIIDRIPKFWGTAICHHHSTMALTPEERTMLEFLKSIDIEDNLDCNGSYKLTLTFSDEASQFFEPLVLSKHVVFDDGAEDASGRTESVTEIVFKPGKDPLERTEGKAGDESNDDVDSVLHWFKKDESGVRANVIDIGEVIRRDIFHTPHEFFSNTFSSDDEDDDEEEDDE